ncbi:hypothetical protein BBK36DRAFT_1118102 [Trichoderma citrinoviride]|uniref:Uncharacterized protein n=1 Tax=Trichoderma citrinoviride TaxID=58853 RepID=A0A2T4BC46_9HYPO|nr:hypothetical protein BBK36DRAFT_1118102 [Trichoderma citrinoviride]PTB66811.1 hypothetical protein BBK36DRAFT_1118102 [Trichoderma citrinoviride]
MVRETIDLTASDPETAPSSNRKLVYSAWKQQLLNCLNGIVSSGDFAVSRQYQTFANPGLRIAGSEAVIPLPLTDRDAETIRGACREAPFGRGDQTLVDTSVRKTWELDATQFECSNPSWPTFFNRLLNDAAAGLGLPDVSAKPHKLLLYEKGSFFKRHKDSEKEAGMIATLVVCLPGIHKGGDVHLSFGSERRALATAPASAFDVTALAWYSDVDHEVKPLDTGNRLALTYNLFQSGSVKQSAQFLFERSQQLKSIIGKWQANFPEVPMIVYPLAHKYSQSSLSLNNMKGRDRAICHSLKEASTACGLYLVLAHMTHTADEFDSYYATDEGETSTTLKSIYSCDGAQIGSNDIIDDSVLLDSDMFTDRDADSQDEEEFTGNESAPISLRYHDTVAVLIPRHRVNRFLKSNNYRATRDQEVENLVSMVKQDYEEHRESSGVKSSTLKVMTEALAVSSSPPQLTMACTIAKWALEAKFEDLYQQALSTALCGKVPPKELVDVVSRHLDEAFAKDPKDVDWQKWLGPFLRTTSLAVRDLTAKMFIARLKTKTLQDSLRAWAQPQFDLKLDTQEHFTVDDHDYFLSNLVPAQYNDVTVKDLFENTLRTARSRLALQPQDLIAKHAGVSFPYVPKNHASSVLLRQFTTLIKQSLTVGVSQQAIELVEHCYRAFNAAKSSWDPSRFHDESLVEDLLVPLASAFHSCNVCLTPDVRAFFELLIRHALHTQVPKYPKAMTGWRHKRRGCGRCEDCAALDIFLESEVERVWNLRAAQHRRSHIEGKLPASIFRYQTIASKSPYTLRVEKLGTEFQEEVRDFRSKFLVHDGMLAPLRGAIFQSILGDVAYRELIELEHLRGKLPAAVAGVKRPSQSDVAGDSARQRL